MSYPLNIEGFEGQNLEIQTSFWTGPKLLVNGQPAPKGKKWGQLTLTRNNGQEVTVAWQQQMLGLDLPQLVVDGQVIKLVEPLLWYQKIWISLPVLLIFAGGFLGAFVGVIATYVNIKLFRAELSEALKYLVTGGVCVLAWIIYFAIAIPLMAVLQG